MRLGCNIKADFSASPIPRCNFIFFVALVMVFGLGAGSFAQDKTLGRPREMGPQSEQTPNAPEPVPPESNGEVPPDAQPALQEGEPLGPPQPIIVGKTGDSMEDRLKREITLDVRDMNVLDILRFLAMKGEFNMVASSAIQGRATFFLKSVTIKDALDITSLSSNLAYFIDKEILHVMMAADYEGMFGKKFNDRNVIEIIQLKYARPTYVLAALDNVKSSLGRIIIDEDTGTVVMIDSPESVAQMSKVIKEIEVPLETFVYTLQYAKADVVVEKLKSQIDGNKVGTVSADIRNNQVILRAFPGRQKEVEALIKSLDTPTKEVLIEARVLQVIFRPQLDVGIDWNLDFRRSKYQALRRMSFNNIFLSEDNLTSSDNLYENYGKFAVGDFDENQFEASIRALKQVSDTKILSNPKILVTNNQEAKIHIGDSIPYIISTTSGTGDNAITSEDVRFVDVGLQLAVTPTINEDGFVTMTLRPEISSVTSTIDSQGGGIPQVNKTLVETTVIVKDGFTIVLGGLKKENKTQTRKGIPFLMDIPLLGRAFGSTTDSIESTEIVIFITPRIVTGTENILEHKNLIKSADLLNLEMPQQGQVDADKQAAVGLRIKE